MENGDRLNTWKEIADYLDCDPRTCSRWEDRHGLPVHRLDDQVKSRVYAYKHELDEWLATRSSLRSEAGEGASRTFRLPGWKLPVLIGAVMLALVTWMTVRSLPGTPADFTIEASRLVILDKSERRLWEFDTKRAKLKSEAAYRATFNGKANNKSNTGLPFLMIRDMDGDRRPEVLFALSTTDCLDSDRLYCLDRRGHKLWDISTQRTIRYSDNLVTSFAYFKGFDVADLDGDGRLEVIVVSPQTMYFPTRLILLDHRGMMQGEYWNSGRIGDFTTVDIDGDGRREILICGVNNEYKQAFLAVLDSRDIQGGSPQIRAEYTGEGIERGSHLAYLLFPRSDVCRAGAAFGIVKRVQIHPENRINVILVSGVIYDLDFDLRVRSVNFSTIFDLAHARLRKQGIIQGEIDDDYRRRLKDGVIRHDGHAWSRPPDIQTGG